MMATVLEEVKGVLHSYANPQKIADYRRFFKTGKGEYGEGDQFLGITVPHTRSVVKRYHAVLSMREVHTLLYSKFHEERMLALLVLVAKYRSKQNQAASKEEVYAFYMTHIGQINNWDLVDVTCPHIVGVHLLDRDRSVLYEFARSDDLWKKRVAIISTFAFIKVLQYEDTLNISTILLHDSHDLIHKAVGWALRNVGIKDLDAELTFLKTRYKAMPRTMLRYAIEKFDEPLRQQFLSGSYAAS